MRIRELILWLERKSLGGERSHMLSIIVSVPCTGSFRVGSVICGAKLCDTRLLKNRVADVFSLTLSRLKLKSPANICK